MPASLQDFPLRAKLLTCFPDLAERRVPASSRLQEMSSSGQMKRPNLHQQKRRRQPRPEWGSACSKAWGPAVPPRSCPNPLLGQAPLWLRGKCGGVELPPWGSDLGLGWDSRPDLGFAAAEIRRQPLQVLCGRANALLKPQTRGRGLSLPPFPLHLQRRMLQCQLQRPRQSSPPRRRREAPQFAPETILGSIHAVQPGVRGNAPQLRAQLPAAVLPAPEGQPTVAGGQLPPRPAPHCRGQRRQLFQRWLPVRYVEGTPEAVLPGPSQQAPLYHVPTFGRSAGWRHDLSGLLPQARPLLPARGADARWCACCRLSRARLSSRGTLFPQAARLHPPGHL